eukprot:6165861-Amphidinium_carterae.1
MYIRKQLDKFIDKQVALASARMASDWKLLCVPSSYSRCRCCLGDPDISLLEVLVLGETTLRDLNANEYGDAVRTLVLPPASEVADHP